jgi:simple sugar transport system ATP-binding protein
VLELSLVDVCGATETLSLHQVSLVVRAGEIMGVAGTPLNGQDTLAAVVAGARRPTRGQIKLFGRTPRRFDPALFVRAGIGKVPADCRREGLVGAMSVAENLLLERVDSKEFARHGLLGTRAMRDNADKLSAAFGLPGLDPDVLVETLPAATAQKLVHRPYVILAHDPTRGLDLTTRADMHRRLAAEREDGAAILLISTDLDELLALSDQIGVLHRGRLSVPQPAGAFDHHSLGLMMRGHGSLAQDWSGWGGVHDPP